MAIHPTQKVIRKFKRKHRNRQLIRIAQQFAREAWPFLAIVAFMLFVFNHMIAARII